MRNVTAVVRWVMGKIGAAGASVMVHVAIIAAIAAGWSTAPKPPAVGAGEDLVVVALVDGDTESATASGDTAKPETSAKTLRDSATQKAQAEPANPTKPEQEIAAPDPPDAIAAAEEDVAKPRIPETDSPAPTVLRTAAIVPSPRAKPQRSVQQPLGRHTPAQEVAATASTLAETGQPSGSGGADAQSEPAKSADGGDGNNASDSWASTGRPLHAPPPRYPSQARKRGQEGIVQLIVEVSADGVPLSVRVSKSSSYAALDRAAMRAVKRWRFEPARAQGRARAATVRIPIRFRLDQAS